MEEQELLTFEERQNATIDISKFFSSEIINENTILELEKQADLLKRRNIVLEKIVKLEIKYSELNQELSSLDPNFSFESMSIPSEEEVSSLEKKADLVKRKKKALNILKRLPENVYVCPSEKQIRKLEKKANKTRCGNCAFIDVDTKCTSCQKYFCADCMMEMGQYCECGAYFS